MTTKLTKEDIIYACQMIEHDHPLLDKILTAFQQQCFEDALLEQNERYVEFLINCKIRGNNMADIYFRSAAKALNDFDNLHSELENYLNKDVNKVLTSLSNEVETLLCMYKEVVEGLEKDNERIQELEEELSNVEEQ